MKFVEEQERSWIESREADKRLGERIGQFVSGIMAMAAKHGERLDKLEGGRK